MDTSGKETGLYSFLLILIKCIVLEVITKKLRPHMEWNYYAKKDDTGFDMEKNPPSPLFTTAKILAVMSMTNVSFMNMNSDSTVHFELITQT